MKIPSAEVVSKTKLILDMLKSLELAVDWLESLQKKLPSFEAYPEISTTIYQIIFHWLSAT